MKHRLFVQFRRGLLAAMLLCTAWAGQAQEFIVRVNGSSHLCKNLSFIRAITDSSRVALSDITELELLSGELQEADYAFMRTLTSLEKLTLSTEIDELKYPIGPLPSLREFNGPKVKAVGKGVFYRLGLTSVSLPQATTIGDYAFESCNYLASVYIPLATSVGTGAFLGCYRYLTYISLPAVTSLGDSTFYNCDALSSIILGATPPSVGVNTFDYLHDKAVFRYIRVDDEAAYWADDDGNTADSLWYGWRINKYPDSVYVRINGDTIIYHGNSLEESIYFSRIIPEAITALEIIGGDMTPRDWVYLHYTFTELKHFSISNSYEVGKWLDLGSVSEFSGDSIKSVGNGTFSGSTVTNVTLPVVTTIGDSAFYNCSALDSMQLGATPPAVGKNVFDGCPSPRYLTLVDANGKPLVGDTLATAIAAYIAASGSKSVEWYGWTIVGTTNSAGSSNNQTGLFDTKLDALSVFPNPTVGAVQVEMPKLVEGAGIVLLYNANGHLLQRVASQGKVLIDLSNYPAGMYIIRVGNAVAKVVKQ